jgi:hypothetical protein
VWSCARHRQHSYSCHDPQKCCVAGTGRNDPDDRSPVVDIHLQLPQCPAGSGSCGHAVPVIHLCVWLLQCDVVLLRVPHSAVVEGESLVQFGGDDLAKAVSHPCGRGGRASPVSELRWFPSESCVRRHPCPASLRGQRVRVRCTPGSGWQSRVYLASVRTLPHRRSTLAQEMSSRCHDTTNAQFTSMHTGRVGSDLLPGGVSLVSGVSEVLGAFVATPAITPGMMMTGRCALNRRCLQSQSWRPGDFYLVSGL